MYRANMIKRCDYSYTAYLKRLYLYARVHCKPRMARLFIVRTHTALCVMHRATAQV